MNPTGIGIAIFAFTLGGALLGMRLRSCLPEGQLDAESKDTYGWASASTMTALVLGLVTASAKSSLDAVAAGIRQYAIDLLALDRALARYGPETREIRSSLQRVVGARIEMVWGSGSSEPLRLDPIRAEPAIGAEGLTDVIRGLSPRDELQRSLQLRALELAETLLRARWLAIVVTRTSIRVPFLVVLLFWLTLTFASFGLFAPRNMLVVTVLFVCALSVASARRIPRPGDGRTVRRPAQGLARPIAPSARAAQSIAATSRRPAV